MTGPGNNPNINVQQELADLQNQLTSLGAMFSNTIRDAVANASDVVQKDIIQKTGASLTSAFSKLASSSEEFSKNASKINKGLLDSKGISEQLSNLEEQKLDFLKKVEAARAAGIPISQRQVEYSIDNLETQKSFLQTQKAIVDSTTKQVGLLGKVAEGLSQIPGLGKVINAKGVVEELRKASMGLDENGNLVKKNTNGFQLMGVAAGTIGKQLAGGMLNASSIIGVVIKQFFALNKASVELRRLTGDTATSFNVMANGAASAVEILETAAELTKQTGLNAQSAFSQDVIANAADLKVEMGLAANEAGGIAVMAQTSGKSVDGMVDSIVASTSAFNGANRAAVSQGVVLRDVAKASASIKASLASNPVSLANAAAQAKLLATDLAGLDKIAESLLNFESSIEAELEAQLLTGNQINLSKARELALNNDLEGVGKEIFKNTVDIEKFGRMGRLGQEAQAKALGMSRDQLAEIAYQTALNTGMTEEQAAAAANVNAEDMKRIEVQKNFTAALNKVMGALAPILEAVGNLFSIPLFGPMLAGALIIIPAFNMIAGQVSAFIGLFAAKTAATVADTAATTAQAAANAGLATSNTAVASTSAAASGGFVAMGTSLGAFGTAAASAIPVMLTIAAVAAGIGLAFAGVGYALKQVPEILSMITAEKATGMILLGQAFSGLALGLAAIAVSGLAALPVLYGLQKLGVMGGTVTQDVNVGGTVTQAQKPVESTQAPAPSLSLDPLVSEVKLMREELSSLMKQFINKDSKIYMDGYEVGQRTQIAQNTF